MNECDLQWIGESIILTEPNRIVAQRNSWTYLTWFWTNRVKTCLVRSNLRQQPPFYNGHSVCFLSWRTKNPYIDSCLNLSKHRPPIYNGHFPVPKVAVEEFSCSWNYYFFGNSNECFFKVMPFRTVDLSFHWNLASFGWWIIVIVGKFEGSTNELCINTKKRWQDWVVQFNKREKKSFKLKKLIMALSPTRGRQLKQSAQS